MYYVQISYALHMLLILLCNFISVLGKKVTNVERTAIRRCKMEKREGVTYIILRKIYNFFTCFCVYSSLFHLK